MWCDLWLPPSSYWRVVILVVCQIGFTPFFGMQDINPMKGQSRFTWWAVLWQALIMHYISELWPRWTSGIGSWQLAFNSDVSFQIIARCRSPLIVESIGWVPVLSPVINCIWLMIAIIVCLDLASASFLLFNHACICCYFSLLHSNINRLQVVNHNSANFISFSTGIPRFGGPDHTESLECILSHIKYLSS